MKEKKTATPEERKRTVNAMETLATTGMLLIAIGLVSPVFGISSGGWLIAFKYIFSAGALMYLVGRVVTSFSHGESLRVRRIRRMEMWAGVAFCIAAFFWFWNTRHASMSMLPGMSLRMLGDTIAFTLAGAMIQLVSTAMLSRAQKKEAAETIDSSDDKKKK